jgi:tRNA pseudouridine synthase 10
VRLFLESRYRKLQRGLPQTIFWCPECKGDRRRRKDCAHCGGAGKLSEESVQELIGRRLLPAFKARTGLFHGAGREDRDVLMLGRGRPFVYEVVGARNLDVDLEALRLEIQARSAGALELAPFVRVSRKRVPYWKEAHFDKVYRAEVLLAAPVEPARLQEAAAFRGGIVQRTPQRVAHRRADLDRQRQVRVLSLRELDGGRLEVRVQCQHGTYAAVAGGPARHAVHLSGARCRGGALRRRARRAPAGAGQLRRPAGHCQTQVVLHLVRLSARLVACGSGASGSSGSRMPGSDAASSG